MNPATPIGRGPAPGQRKKNKRGAEGGDTAQRDGDPIVTGRVEKKAAEMRSADTCEAPSSADPPKNPTNVFSAVDLGDDHGIYTGPATVAEADQTEGGHRYNDPRQHQDPEETGGQSQHVGKNTLRPEPVAQPAARKATDAVTDSNQARPEGKLLDRCFK